MTEVMPRRHALSLGFGLIALCGTRLQSAAPAATVQPTGPVKLPESWTFAPAWSDDFPGAQLDGTRWHDNDPVWPGREPSRFEPSNVQQQTGRLVLASRASGQSGPIAYLTAAVKSRSVVRYGFFETRARAGASAVSSAFWLYARDARRWTEIDVFEMCGAPGRSRQLFTNAHVFYDIDRGLLPSGGDLQSLQATQLDFDVHKDFHVYGLNWSPDRLEWWIDGKLVRTLANRYWHQQLNIVFDSEVFRDWFGIPEAGTLPARFEVEYLRVWRPAEGET
ncbi:MAG: family 16 glycosylhydrolase [Ramlibacter sp.]